MIRFYSDKYPDLVPFSVPTELKYWELFKHDKVGVYTRIFMNFNAQPREETGSDILIGKQVIMSAAFDVPENYASFNDLDKQALTLEMIDSALRSLAIERRKLDIAWLDKVKAEILSCNFDFWIPVKHFKQKTGSKEWAATLILHPQPGSYEVYLDISRNNMPGARYMLYETIPDRKTAIGLFEEGKWSADGILSLQSDIAEVKVSYDAVHDRLDFSLTSRPAANFEAYGAVRMAEYTDKAVFLNKLPAALKELLE